MRLENMRGTMIGCFISKGLGDLNFPGLHMHFLSEGLSYGGHVLDVELCDVALRPDPVRSFTILVTESVIT